MTPGKQAAMAGGLALSMLGLAFASDPIYDTFCKVTGFGGTVTIAESAPEYVSERQMHVRFDTNVFNAPIEFLPLQREQTTNIGAHTFAAFEARNTSDRKVSVVATYNVTPHKSGPYFQKLECFCLDEMVLFEPGETKRLPLVYFISPELEQDTATDELTYITLSYSFFESARS